MSYPEGKYWLEELAVPAMAAVVVVVRDSQVWR